MNQAEDVEVILGPKRRYKFHSGTLARNSTRFAEMLREPNAAKLNSRAKHAGVKIRWMIELTQLPDDSKHPGGCLELVVCYAEPGGLHQSQVHRRLTISSSLRLQASAQTVALASL